MTSDEIHAMSDQELDAAVKAELWLDGDSPVYCKVYMISRHPGACYEAEERLKEMGLLKAFGCCLHYDQFAADCCLGELAHATARQRAEAILAAVQGKE